MGLSGETVYVNPNNAALGGAAQYAVWTTPGYSAPFGLITAPSPSATISGTYSITGWALDNGIPVQSVNVGGPQTPISSVEVLVDGVHAGWATRQLPGSAVGSPTDPVGICASYPSQSGINSLPGVPGWDCPNYGWKLSWDSTQVANGTHTLAVVFTDTDPPVHNTTTTLIPFSTSNLTVVGTPTFTPAAGTYFTTQSVTLHSATAGANIYYTTDGSAPSQNSSLFNINNPITVNSSETIRAIALMSGMANSQIASAIYTIVSPGTPWINNSWTGRKPIVVNHTQVSGSSNLTSFPILFSVTDPSLRNSANGGSVAQTNGNGILFTAADGVTKLNHELESYNPATGQVIAWVSVPTLSYTADTVLYVYFGNAGATNQQNPTQVWDSGFQGVWHLPNGSSLSAADSTSNGNNGPNTAATAASGQIDGAASFDGSSQTINVGAMASTEGQSALTISAWVKPNALVWIGAMVAKFQGAPAGDSYVLEEGVNGSDVIAAILANTNDQNTYGKSGTGLLSVGTWTHLSMVFDGTQTGNANRLSLYADGVPQLLTFVNSVPASTPASSAPVTLGSSAFAKFNGTLDEVRISNVARSAGWIGTEYANQNSPGTFLTIGNLQQVGGTVAMPTFSPIAGLYTTAQSVQINTATTGASIRYTTDGVTTPTETTGTLYTGTAVSISSTSTLKAIAYEAGMTDSSVATGVYTIAPVVATPTFSPVAGSYTTAQSVQINTATTGASIRYTTDGVTTPTETAGTLYTGTAVSISSTTTLKAIAYEAGMTDSSVATGVYTIAPVVATPTFSPAAGSYTTAQSVQISTATTGASIRYTTDGVTTPTETTGTLYTGTAVSISSTTTLKAIAYKTGMTDSSIASGTYTISVAEEIRPRLSKSMTTWFQAGRASPRPSTPLPPPGTRLWCM